MKFLKISLLVLLASCTGKSKSTSSPQPAESLNLSGKEYNTVLANDDKENYSDISLYLKADGSYELSKRIISSGDKRVVDDYEITPAFEEQASGTYAIVDNQVTLSVPSFSTCPSHAAAITLKVQKSGENYRIGGKILRNKLFSYTAETVNNPSYSILSLTKGKTREMKVFAEKSHLITYYGCLNDDLSVSETSSTELTLVQSK